MKLLRLMLAAMMLTIAGCHDDGDCANGHCHQPAPVIVQEEAPVVETPPATVEVPTAPPNVGNTPPITSHGFPVIDTGITGTKRAVLVGINKFKNPGAPELSGCVHDIDIRIMLICLHSWGFKPENIVFLKDEQATVANVKKALNDMVAATKDGDGWVYWQSSHGAEDAVSADAAQQPDHMNQLVCCYDFDWDREHELIDEDFVEIFSKLPKGAAGLWGSDSCHSGDLDRDIVKPRAKRNTPKSITPAAGTAAATRIAKAKAKNLPVRSIKTGLLNVAFISGCKYDETSADTEDDNGQPGGEMTIAFMHQYLLGDNYKLPFKELVKLVAQEAKPFGQTPTASGGRTAKPVLFP